MLGNGSRCTFGTVDNVIAWFATDNPYIHGEFERLMSESRYGLTEVTQEEFHREFVEKKKALNGRPLNPRWREEVGTNKVLQDTVLASVNSRATDHAAAGDPSLSTPNPNFTPQPVPVQASEERPATGEAPQTEFKPATGKRKPRK